MKKTVLILIMAMLANVLTAYANVGDIDSLPNKKAKKEKPKKEKSEIRTGWTFGILPSVGYDADKGFQYGVGFIGALAEQRL